MKAISLTQPWATLIALGAKRIETRSWSTPYRGALGIHAAKSFPRWARDTCDESEFAKELGAIHLPLGFMLATCRLVACIPTRELQHDRLIELDPACKCEPILLDSRERIFGDFSPGRWAWLLADVHPLDLPVPAKGALGLWEWNQ